MRTMALSQWIVGFTLAACAARGALADRTLVHEAVIDAPIAEVWRMCTTNDGASQWMAPKIDIDLRVGGVMRSSYNPQSTLNDEHTIINRILAYEPQRMLAIRNEQAPAGFKWVENFQSTWSVMYFNPLGEDRTRLRIVGMGYGEGPEWDELYQHFEQGNQYLINKLQSLVTADGEPDDEVDLPIDLEVVVSAPVADVWHAWTTNEGMQAFWAPRANVELKIGGDYEVLFLPDSPPGQRGAENQRVLSFVPMEMLAFEWTAPPHLPNARQHPNWVVLFFEAISPDETRVRLVHLGWAERKAEHPEHAAEWEQAREYFVKAWPNVLRHLQERFVRTANE